MFPEHPSTFVSFKIFSLSVKDFVVSHEYPSATRINKPNRKTMTPGEPPLYRALYFQFTDSQVAGGDSISAISGAGQCFHLAV